MLSKSEHGEGNPASTQQVVHLHALRKWRNRIAKAFHDGYDANIPVPVPSSYQPHRRLGINEAEAVAQCVSPKATNRSEPDSTRHELTISGTHLVTIGSARAHVWSSWKRPRAEPRRFGTSAVGRPVVVVGLDRAARVVAASQPRDLEPVGRHFLADVECSHSHLRAGPAPITMNKIPSSTLPLARKPCFKFAPASGSHGSKPERGPGPGPGPPTQRPRTNYPDSGRACRTSTTRAGSARPRPPQRRCWL